MRSYLVACTLMGAFVFGACGGSGSPTPTVAPRTATVPASRTATPSLRTATPNAPRPSPTGQRFTPAPSGESGVEGTVTIGPTCPVQRIESPCPDRPYEAAITALDASGHVAAQTRSAADGRFRMLLPTGTYTLRTESTGALPRAWEESVVVESGRFATIQIVLDSGIR